MEKCAYIRPVCQGDIKILSLALCRYEDRTLGDEDIIDHFPPDTPGVEIKEMAVEYGHATTTEHVHWAAPIFVT